MVDNVNSPAHYTSGGIETIDYIEAKLSKEEFIGYCKANIIKYLSRGPLKGKEGEDYRKAQWYCQRLVRAIENGNMETNGGR